MGSGQEARPALKFKILFTSDAEEDLNSIRDRRVRQLLSERIDKLAIDPGVQGKPLQDEMMGLRSVRAVGQRFRIVYQVQNNIVTVLIVGVGMRKDGDKQDVYAKIKRLKSR